MVLLVLLVLLVKQGPGTGKLAKPVKTSKTSKTVVLPLFPLFYQCLPISGGNRDQGLWPWSLFSANLRYFTTFPLFFAVFTLFYPFKGAE